MASVSAKQGWSASFALRGALLLVTLTACSSDASSASTNSAQGTAVAAAGTSAAAAGKVATTGTAGKSAAGAGAATSVGAAGAKSSTPISTIPTGNKGDVTSPVSAGAGGMSIASQAGSGAAGTTGAAGTNAGAAGANMSTAADGCVVAPITMDMRSHYQDMDAAYYTKFASANGVIVATGDKVDDEAVIRYCRLLTEMWSNDQIHKAVLSDKMWFTMIAQEEQLSSLPQINRDYGASLNARARGLGGLTPTICAEDSIMCSPGDMWNGDCICPHETGHTLYSSGIQMVPDLSKRLTDITNATRQSGRIANSYVWMDGDESGMMAWGVQVWYDCAIDGMMGGYHPDINTRAELQKELPDFYQFLSELLPKDNQYKDCYANP